MGTVGAPALMCVFTFRPCVGFWTRTSVSLWLRSVAPALPRVFTCTMAPLLLVYLLYLSYLPWGTAYAVWQLVSTQKLFPLSYETLHPSFLRVSFKGGF